VRGICCILPRNTTESLALNPELRDEQPQHAACAGFLMSFVLGGLRIVVTIAR
jgi:hypothetical protein